MYSQMTWRESWEMAAEPPSGTAVIAFVSDTTSMRKIFSVLHRVLLFNIIVEDVEQPCSWITCRTEGDFPDRR